MKGMKGMKGMKKGKKGMRKAMKIGKVRKGRSITKGDLCAELEASTGVAKRDGMKILKGIEEALPELFFRSSGKVTIPGIARVVIRRKKATKAGKRMMFGQEVKVKAMKARNVVKAFPAKQLKDQF